MELCHINGTAGPTASCHDRRFTWLSFGTGVIRIPKTGEELPADGLLWITQQFAKTRAGKTAETDCYAVQEMPAEVPGTRLFFLLNLTDETQQQPYEVTVGGVNACRCRAGQCRNPVCKHRDVILALIEEGGLPVPAPEPLSVPAAELAELPDEFLSGWCPPGGWGGRFEPAVA